MESGPARIEGADAVPGGRAGRWGWLIWVVLALALGVRLYGLDWDQGNLFHPDERKILQVVDSIHFPPAAEWRLLFIPESPWNPHFFAYGSFPIYLLRIAIDVLAGEAGQPGTMPGYLMGRLLMVLADMGTVWLTYRLGKRLYSGGVGVLAAALVAGAVLHVQLAHFGAVDPLLTFLVVLALVLSAEIVRRPYFRRLVGLGAVIGLAMATKVSAAALWGPALAAWGAGLWLAQAGPSRRVTWAMIWRALNGAMLLLFGALLLFYLAEPYAVLAPAEFWGDLVQESRMVRGADDIPYTRQYIATPAYLYSLWQLAAWGLGFPLALAGLAGLAAAGLQSVRRLTARPVESVQRLLPVLWVLVYFAIVGGFHTKFARYMLPITPFLCLWAAQALAGLRRRVPRALTVAVVLGGTWFYALAFVGIYGQEHTWIQATRWICANVPAGSRIMLTHWDDALPIAQGRDELSCYYTIEALTFPAYDADSLEKQELLLDMLEASDYIVLPTNRLYGTLARLPERYPMSARFYQALFAEDLGFELVHFDRVRPNLLGVYWADDGLDTWPLATPRLLAETPDDGLTLHLGRPDESFTVYDHPTPLIFAKTQALTRADYMRALAAATAAGSGAP